MNRRDVMQQEVPKDFLGGLLVRLFQIYETAPEATEKIVQGKEEQSDLLPFVRRSLVEQSLRLLAKKWDMVGNAHPSGGFWHHRRVESGRIIITQNTASEPDAMLKSADYKVRYSFGLFTAEQIEAAKATSDVTDDEQVYAVLSHGRVKGTIDRLGFAVFKFPKQGFDECWPEEYDLFEAFPEIVTKRLQRDDRTTEENVEDTAIPELRSQEHVS